LVVVGVHFIEIIRNLNDCNLYVAFSNGECASGLEISNSTGKPRRINRNGILRRAPKEWLHDGCTLVIILGQSQIQATVREKDGLFVVIIPEISIVRQWLAQNRQPQQIMRKLTPGRGRSQKDQWQWWFVAPISSVPPVLLAVLLTLPYLVAPSSDAGLEIERLISVSWLAVAGMSLAWVVTCWLRCKSKRAWVFISLHLIVACSTIVPGFYTIAHPLH